MSTRHQGSLQRVRHPFHVMIKGVGPICNIACDYCYYLEKTALYPDEKKFRMSPELLERFIRSYIRAHPGPTVIFPWHGGEPTLLGIDFFRTAVDLQQRHLPPGWRCINAPQTNGTLLDEEWCRFFKEHGFAVGISIDGPAAFHDAHRVDRRQRPTHERVMAGLRLLQRHGVPHTVLCTVNNRNVCAPREVYGFFREHGVTAMQFLPIVRHVGDGRVSEQTVDPADFGRFLIAVFDEWLQHDAGRVWVQIIEECMAKVRGEAGTLCLFQETCGDSLALEHNGDLYACDHYVREDYRLGNIARQSLKALVDSAALRRFASAKRDTLPALCRTCDVRFACNGGCPKDRFISTPDGEPGLNYLCEGYRSFFRHAAPRLRELHRLLQERLPPAARSTAGPARRPAAFAAPRRNDPCPCGSGRKYKHCCLS